ncbi:hypothetical protein F4802DRAFT_226715 [Xylaria palmicola]|nr:hypothetical protein F4802DRAFT_226715 [Xylaria palmicola]
MPISRKKACEQCRLAKTRCSLERICSRCFSRGLACEYNGGLSRVGPYTRQHVDEPEYHASLASPATVVGALSSLLSPPNLRVANLGFGIEGTLDENTTLDNTGLSNWDSHVYSGPQVMLQDPATWNNSQVARPPPRPEDLESRETHSHPTTLGGGFTSVPAWGFGETPRFMDTLSNLHATATPEHSTETVENAEDRAQSVSLSVENETTTEIENHSTFTTYERRVGNSQALRRGTTTEQYLMARILVGQVQNYPRMLIRGSRLPPFIFPHCVLNDKMSYQCTAVNGTHQCLPEPLANCAALTQIFYSRTSSNAQLVWRTIYDEQKRLREQAHDFDVPTLLASLQAVVIYILLQAQDNESIVTNDVTSMAVTLAEMAITIHYRGEYQTEILQNPDLTQARWVVHESIRRTISLFYVIKIVLMIQIGTPTQYNSCTVRSTPLPCGRDLWDPEATDSWAVRLQRYKSLQLSHRGLIINDLHRGEKPGKKDPADALLQQDLAIWCEMLDDLGTLVWMASLLDRHAE